MKDSRVIAIEDLSFSYEGPPVLEHVTLDVERGEMLGCKCEGVGDGQTHCNTIRFMKT